MKCNTREWLVDTGATSHITPHSYDLARSQTCKVPFSIVGGGSTHASLIGDLVLLLPTTLGTRRAPYLIPRCFTRSYHVRGQDKPILALPALRKAKLDLDLQENVIFSEVDPRIRVPIFYKHGLPHVRIAVTTDETCYQQAFAATPMANVTEDALSRIKDAFGPYDHILLPADYSKYTLQRLHWTNRRILAIPPPNNADAIYETVLKALREFSSHKPPDTRITLVVPINPKSQYHAHLSRFHRAAVYKPGTPLFETHGAQEAIAFPKTSFGLYYKDIRSQSHISPTMLLHLRLGHPSPAIMDKLISSMADTEKETGLPGHMPRVNLRHSDMCDCIVCQVANQKRPRNLGPDVETHTPAEPFEYVGMDVHGPLVLSPNKFQYALIIVCYLTRWVYYDSLRSKGEAGAAFGRFLLWVKKREWSDQPPHTRTPVKSTFILKSDNAKEFIGAASILAQLCQREGIKQYLASAYCHEEMGMVEKRWSPIAAKSRAMLLTASMSSDLWPHSYRHAVYLENRLPKQSLGWKSPYEVLCGRKPVLHHLLTFGSPCSLIIGDTGADAKIPKTQNKAFPSLLWIGHADNSNAALFLDMSDRKTVRRGGMFRSRELSGLPNLGRITHPWELDKFAPLSSEFESTFLPHAMIKSVPQTDPPTITGHRVYRADEGNAPVARLEAVLCVQPSDGPEKCITVADYVESGGTGPPIGRLSAYRAYMSTHFHSNPLNEAFPLFSTCSATREASPSGDNEPVWETGAVVTYTHSSTQRAELDEPKFDVLVFNNIETLRSLEPHQVDLVDSSDPSAVAMAAIATSIDGVTLPRNMKELLAAPDCAQWSESVVTEILTLEKMETFDITNKCPKGITPVGVVLKFKVKYKADGSLDKRKSRLVAQGFKQLYLQSYTDTFAPASQLDTLRLLVSYAAQYRLRISSIDVIGAFLNAKIKEDIWIKFPDDLPVPNLKGQTAKLKRSLYGLKQAAHDWWVLLRSFFHGDKKLKISPNAKDPCLYHIFSDTLIVIIVVHVDDCIIAYNDDNFIKTFREQIESKYEITFTETPTQVLGIQLDHLSDGSFTLRNTRLIDESVRTFGQENAHPKKIPMDPGTVLTIGEDTPDPKISYLSLVGVLMWIMRCSRPDINVAVSMLASFSHCYTAAHYQAAINVLLFLKGTRTHCLVYKHTPLIPRGATRLSLYTDADYAVCKVTRRSRSGWVILMGTNVIAYNSSRQKLVTLSSTESELVALCDGSKSLLGTIQVVQHFVPAELPVSVHVDNQGAIAIGTDEIHNNRTKHIDVRYFFTRELVDDGTIDVIYIASEDNPADPLTKLLAYPAYCTGMQRLSILPAPKGAGGDTRPKHRNK